MSKEALVCDPSTLTPIVVIGMHRSGTSVLVELLRQAGVFMGADLQGNQESITFLQINDACFWRCHSTWSNPFGIYLALRDEKRTIELAQFALDSVAAHVSTYLGSNQDQGFGALTQVNTPWGWKDPRSTFTLPMWRYVFPKLKVIHILRHGVDVASSMYQRDWCQFHQDMQHYLPALTVMQDAFGLHQSRRGWTLEQAFTLWEEYVEMAVQQVEALGENALQLKYEDLLSSPQAVLTKLLKFCGMGRSAPPPESLDLLRPTRAYAYGQSEELTAFAQQWRRSLERFGY